MLQKTRTKLWHHCSPSQAVHAPTFAMTNRTWAGERAGHNRDSWQRVVKQLITYSYILETGWAFLAPLGLV